MSLHHIKLVHGSDPNRTDDRRIGLAIRYIPTYVRQTKVRDAAMLVRGVDNVRATSIPSRARSTISTTRRSPRTPTSVGRQVKALYSGHRQASSSAPERARRSRRMADERKKLTIPDLLEAKRAGRSAS